MAAGTLELDPLDASARNEMMLTGGLEAAQYDKPLFGGDAQTCLDIALDYAEAGCWDDADEADPAISGRRGRERSASHAVLRAGLVRGPPRRARHRGQVVCAGPEGESGLLFPVPDRRDPGAQMCSGLEPCGRPRSLLFGKPALR